MGNKYLFLRFFLLYPFLRRALHQKLFFCVFFAFRGLGLIHFVALQETGRTLDSGIAVHSTNKHQQAWFRSTSFSTNQFPTRP